MNKRIQTLAQVLKLDHIQRKRLQHLVSQANYQLAQMADEELRTWRTLRGYLRDAKGPEARLEQTLIALSEHQADAKLLRVITVWRIRNLLTREQRSILAERSLPPKPGTARRRAE